MQLFLHKPSKTPSGERALKVAHSSGDLSCQGHPETSGDFRSPQPWETAEGAQREVTMNEKFSGQVSGLPSRVISEGLVPPLDSVFWPG